MQINLKKKKKKKKKKKNAQVVEIMQFLRTRYKTALIQWYLIPTTFEVMLQHILSYPQSFDFFCLDLYVFF